MSDSQKKPKATLESLLINSKVITGKTMIERQKAKEVEQELFQRAIEFEERNRKFKKTRSSKAFD
jgi:hypothetical protein